MPISQQTVTWSNVEQYLWHQLLWLKHYEFVLHILSTARSRFCEYVKRMAFYGCLCWCCIFLCITTCKRCIHIPVLCCVFYLSISNIFFSINYPISAIKQQNITWTNADLYLCRHGASPRNSELTLEENTFFYIECYCCRQYVWLQLLWYSCYHCVMVMELRCVNTYCVTLCNWVPWITVTLAVGFLSDTS